MFVKLLFLKLENWNPLCKFKCSTCPSSYHSPNLILSLYTESIAVWCIVFCEPNRLWSVVTKLHVLQEFLKETRCMYWLNQVWYPSGKGLSTYLDRSENTITRSRNVEIFFKIQKTTIRYWLCISIIELISTHLTLLVPHLSTMYYVQVYTRDIYQNFISYIKSNRTVYIYFGVKQVIFVC